MLVVVCSLIYWRFKTQDAIGSVGDFFILEVASMRFEKVKMRCRAVEFIGGPACEMQLAVAARAC